MQANLQIDCCVGSVTWLKVTAPTCATVSQFKHLSLSCYIKYYDHSVKSYTQKNLLALKQMDIEVLQSTEFQWYENGMDEWKSVVER